MRSTFLLATFCVCVYATVYNINPGDEFVSILKSLQAGDTVNFLPGTHYTGSSKADFVLPGSASQPIIIQGNGSATINRADTAQNIWDFSGTYFEIKNLEFTGGSRGLRIGNGKNVSHGLFENISIHDTTGTAMTFNDYGHDYHDIIVRRVEIYNTGNKTMQHYGNGPGSGTGECVYPGCNNDTCVFHDSLFEYVFCHDTLSAQNGYGSGINLKSGSYNTTVRHSVFWNTRSPGILFYDSYDRGNNIAYGNLIVNTQDAGIQFTAGAVIRDNIVINSLNAGLFGSTNQLQGGKQPRNLQITGNTVIGSIQDACLRGNSWNTNPDTIFVANNALFCGSAPYGAFKISGSAVWANNAYNGGSAPNGVDTTGAFPINSETEELLDPAGYNYYPKASSNLLNNGSVTYLSDEDFNCNARSTSSPTVGAYQYSTASNPGWQISEAMMPQCGSDSDGGSSSAASSTLNWIPSFGVVLSVLVLL